MLQNILCISSLLPNMLSLFQKSRGDWLTFTANMTFIFSKIREYVFRDPHSIAFMFHTLPYNQKGHKQVMHSSRVILGPVDLFSLPLPCYIPRCLT